MTEYVDIALSDRVYNLLPPSYLSKNDVSVLPHIVIFNQSCIIMITNQCTQLHFFIAIKKKSTKIK